MSDDEPEKDYHPLREKAETILRMNGEVKRIQRKLRANAVVIIAMFKDENDQLTFQDVGMFPCPPDQFYDIMQQAHVNGQLGHNSPKLKVTSRIIKPN
jgi:hypothetical protein